MSAAACDNHTTATDESREAINISAWASSVDTISGEYTRVVRPAEFWDSVLIVPDALERLMWKVNLTTGERSIFGSRGDGPGEYARASWALKVHRDSVAIVQGASHFPFPIIDVASERGRTQRFSAISGSLSVREYVAQSVMLKFADTLGYLYGAPPQMPKQTARPEWPANGTDESPELVPLLRFSVRNGATDTVGFVPTPDLDALAIAPSATSRKRRLGTGPYGRYSSWFTLPDGRSVLASGGTYDLEVMSASGELEGPFRIDHPVVAASAEGFERYLDSSMRMSMQLISSTLMRANVSAPSREQAYDIPPKPATLPPLNFAGIRRMFGSGDVVWIPVHVEDPPTREVWDLVNVGSRMRTARVALAANQRLLMVTANGAYVASLNDSDLERILLYRPNN